MSAVGAMQGYCEWAQLEGEWSSDKNWGYLRLLNSNAFYNLNLKYRIVLMQHWNIFLNNEIMLVGQIFLM